MITRKPVGSSIKNILFLFALVLLVLSSFHESSVAYTSSAQQMVEEGKKYLDGKEVPKDYAKAFALFQKAAEQGDAEGQSNLGRMYDRGFGVQQDFAKAMEWYQKAVDQGNAGGQHGMGRMYSIGQGVPQDYKKALEWYQKAAEQGYANAQINIGVMYDNGQGVPQDYKKALEWYQKAAEQGDADAKAKVLEVTNVLNARTKIEVKPVKSIEDGFRGMPWGIHKKEAISLFVLYESEIGEIMGKKAYARKDENLSFGNVNLLSLVYFFGEDFQATDDAKKGFISVLATFESVYFHPLIEEISKSFGQPTLFGGIKNEWHFKNAKIILEMKLDNRYANITIVRQFPEQQNQRGGGF